MTDSTINRKSKHVIWIPLPVLIILAACTTADYSYWCMQQQPSTGARAELPPPPAPIFFVLDTFAVNLGDADRVLYIDITLHTKDEATRSRLNEYLPEVRSHLLLLFSRQNAATLAIGESKQQLIAAIREALVTPLVVGRPKQIVADVLYTASILR